MTSPQELENPKTERTISPLILIIIAVIYLLSILSAVIILIKNPSRSTTQIQKESRLPINLSRGTTTRRTSDTVAIVEIYGPIKMSARISPGSANPDRITRKLRSLADRKDIKAVVLRINSPGGTVAAVQEIYDEVMNLRNKGIKVVASMGDVAASGGYYVASAADKIVANPGTLTGSIGVIMEYAHGQELFKKIGLKIETIKSGKYKDTGSFSRETTPEERQILQSLINDAYSQFVGAIEKGRNIPREKILTFADGRIFTGAQAKELGVIDQLGNRDDAIKLAASLAGIEGEPNVIIEKEPWEEFLQRFDLAQSIGGATGILRYLPISSYDNANSLTNGTPIRFEYSME